jgi:hypothetical protein
VHSQQCNDDSDGGVIWLGKEARLTLHSTSWDTTASRAESVCRMVDMIIPCRIGRTACGGQTRAIVC